MRFETLEQWLAWQETLHPKAIDLGLERVARVAGRLGLLQPAHAVITVAGTNGKGSTVALLESIYRCAGYRVGAYTSPHLLRYNERIRIHGALASDEALCRAFDAVDSARGEESLSYFEFGTLAALWLFREAAPDVVILEVGLGGRLDAVNIVDPDVAVVTSIGIDHEAWLGSDREGIGAEKAGIFRATRPAVCGDPQPPASIEKTAQTLGAELHMAGQDFSWQAGSSGRDWRWQGPGAVVLEDLPMPALSGPIQFNNAATALTAVTLLQARLPVSREALERGLEQVRLPGRFQRLRDNPLVILDVVHNPQGAQVLAASLAHQPVPGRTLAVLAMMADKDVTAVIAALAAQVDRWFAAGLPDVPRAMTVQALGERLAAAVGAAEVSRHATVASAYQGACAAAGPGDRVLVLGSFYTVSQVLALEAATVS
jgi:dihydrofolate synthase/folylpolyglutamate synthase